MEKEQEKKKKFAIELLKNPSDTFKCAKKVFGDNTGDCLKYHNVWPEDLDVLEYQAAYIKENGEESTLPTKERVAREIYDVAHNDREDPDVRLKFYKLYSDVQGYIVKSNVTVNNSSTNISNKVMIVKDHGSDDQWAERLKQQQTKLIDGN